MHPLLAFLMAVLLLCCAGDGLARPLASAEPDFRQAEDAAPKSPQQLSAVTLNEFTAPEADQGAAADENFFYAIDNSAIGKYSLSDGSLLAQWKDQSGSIKHLNSCYVRDAQLWCANSNYPETPMGSSVEIFDTRTLEHRSSHSLGLMEEGSLTWFSPTADGFIAAFAHYDGNGVPYKDHRYSSVVAFDKQWRRTGGWLFPPSVTERMAPHAASGGAIGPDGRLYVTGHDRPEMYVFEMPRRGPYLVHVATIALEIEGQAFGFAPGKETIILAVDRNEGVVRRIRLPTLESE